MVSRKLAKVSKSLAAALMLGTFLPASIALAADTDKDTNAKAAAATTAEAEDSEAVTLAEETNKESSTDFELLDYFVTAERIPTSRWDTPADVTVITAKEIEANHYKSLREALDHVNGVFLSGTLYGTNRTLTLVDGRRAFVIPSLKAIERIEIVKGGGSALYGSDAVGGVINIITKKGDHSETTFDVSTGSWHRRHYDITNQGNDGKLGWFIAGNIYKSRPYDHKGNYWSPVEDTDYDNDGLSVRLDHRFDDRNSLTFNFAHYSGEQAQYDQYDRYLEMSSSRVYLGSLTSVSNDISLTYNFKEGTSTPGFLRYLNDYNSWHSADAISEPDDGNERLQGIDYQNGWELGQHKLITGLEWHQTNRLLNNAYALNNTYEHRKVTNSAYYLQDTIALGDKWTLVPGVRYDHNSAFGHQWSPKFAANYRSDDKTKFYATWGRVYQAPGLEALYKNKQISNSTGTRWWQLFGHSNLEPETGHTESIGVEHDFSDKIRASLSFFNSDISHYLDVHQDASVLPSLKYDYVNSNGYKQRGIELSFKQNINDDWSYDLGYAFTHRDVDTGAEYNRVHSKLPKNSYKAGIHYNHGIWKVNLLGMMGSGNSESYYVEDNFAVLDLNASCDVTDFATIYVKFLNFTNQGYSYYGKYSLQEPEHAFIAGLDCKF